MREFAATVAPNATHISLKQEEVSVDSIKQFYMDCKDEADKARVLCDIYGILTIGQSIIFVRQRKTADMLHAMMESEGHAVSSLHGNFDADGRDKAIDDFREGRLLLTQVVRKFLSRPMCWREGLISCR